MNKADNHVREQLQIHYAVIVYLRGDRGLAMRRNSGASHGAFMQIAAVLTTALLVGWLTRRYVPVAAKPVYLIDTYTYKPPDRCIRSSVDPPPIICTRGPYAACSSC